MSTPVVVETLLLFFILYGFTLVQAQASLFALNNAVMFVEQTLFPVLIVILSFYYNNLYDLHIVRSFSEFAKRLPRVLGVAFVLLYGFYAFFPITREKSDPLFFCILLTIAVLTVILPVRLVLYHFLKISALSERIIILGMGHIASKIVDAIEASSHVSYTIIGLVDDRRASCQLDSQSAKYALLGSLDRLHEILDEHRPDRIVIALTERRGFLPVRDLLDARMAGSIVEDAVDVHERLTKKLAIESLTPSDLFFSKDFNTSRLKMSSRHIVSLAFAFVVLFLVAPFMVLIAILIKMDSYGPVLFIQDRCGWHGRMFRLIKFRTTHPVQSGKGHERFWEQEDGSRVTRVGKWLRKLRLDEIPQFINVLLGDMDLIGPRPELASNVKTCLLYTSDAADE